MTEHHDVFLSHSRNDPVATNHLHAQLRQHNLNVFKDDESIEPGDVWLDRLQSVLEGCGSLRRAGRPRRRAALDRRRDAGGVEPPFRPPRRRAAPADLSDPAGRDGAGDAAAVAAAVPGDALERRRAAAGRRCSPTSAIATSSGTIEPFAGCPFVGLAAYRPDQAHLFFGRQKETLDALACFRRQPAGPLVKWLEINGNSGSGKSSLMNAGPAAADRAGLAVAAHRLRATGRCIGPMMPGKHPVEMLAECLGARVRPEDGRRSTRTFRVATTPCGTGCATTSKTTPPSCSPSTSSRSCSPSPMRTSAAASIACSRLRWKTRTARCSSSPPCAPISSTASPRTCRGWWRCATGWRRPWTLAPIGADGLREVIQGPADLAGLDVSEVKELMVAEARDEPGALPLVENALHWLWQQRDGQPPQRPAVHRSRRARRHPHPRRRRSARKPR